MRRTFSFDVQARVGFDLSDGHWESKLYRVRSRSETPELDGGFCFVQLCL